jgi:PncC family amidohydrolase
MNTFTKKIVKNLIKKRLTISVAESCTGGFLSNSFTSIAGSSKIFTLGIVSYSNQSKSNVLKVPKKTIEKHGSVSEEVCLTMLKNINKMSKTNISISITGIAGPSGGSKKKPVGLVYIGFKKGNKISSNMFLFKNKIRIKIQKAAVKKALELISNSLK